MLSKSLILVQNQDEGLPESTTFRIDINEVNIDNLKNSLLPNQLLVQLLVASADPYLRGQIKSTGSFKAGQVMQCFVAGKVLHSTHNDWIEGDLFGANLPVTSIQVISPQSTGMLWKLTSYLDEEHISQGVGVLGMPGSTAYAGIEGILRPNQNETIFISAASGAVGGLSGMIAKHKYNCKVIGSAGGEEKCALVTSAFKYDHCINYKNANNADELTAMLKEVAPEGIDMYFENVGGMHFEAAMRTLRVKGRVAVCGQIAEYNKKEITYTPVNIMGMIYTQQRIEGFLCFDWLVGKKGKFLEEMSGWLKEGLLHVQESHYEGLEKWPEAFHDLFTGKNLGKVVVHI
jgi:NADPH-dependent curcumin reductase CurA